MDPKEASTSMKSKKKCFFEIETDLALVGNRTCGIMCPHAVLDGRYQYQSQQSVDSR